MAFQRGSGLLSTQLPSQRREGRVGARRDESRRTVGPLGSPRSRVGDAGSASQRAVAPRVSIAKSGNASPRPSGACDRSYYSEAARRPPRTTGSNARSASFTSSPPDRLNLPTRRHQAITVRKPPPTTQPFVDQESAFGCLCVRQVVVFARMISELKPRSKWWRVPPTTVGRGNHRRHTTTTTPRVASSFGPRSTSSVPSGRWRKTGSSARARSPESGNGGIYVALLKGPQLLRTYWQQG
jgi:hypothetical protein